MNVGRSYINSLPKVDKFFCYAQFENTKNTYSLHVLFQLILSKLCLSIISVTLTHQLSYQYVLPRRERFFWKCLNSSFPSELKLPMDPGPEGSSISCCVCSMYGGNLANGHTQTLIVVVDPSLQLSI